MYFVRSLQPFYHYNNYCQHTKNNLREPDTKQLPRACKLPRPRKAGSPYSFQILCIEYRVILNYCRGFRGLYIQKIIEKTANGI
jgi:hypothetical protein